MGKGEDVVGGGRCRLAPCRCPHTVVRAFFLARGVGYRRVPQQGHASAAAEVATATTTVAIAAAAIGGGGHAATTTAVLRGRLR